MTGNAGYIACGFPGPDCDIWQQGPNAWALMSVAWVDPGRLMSDALAAYARRREVERAAWVARHYRFDEDADRQDSEEGKRQ